MKWRKSNRSKRVSGGCRNNNSCSWCRGDRLSQVNRASQQTADDEHCFCGPDNRIGCYGICAWFLDEEDTDADWLHEPLTPEEAEAFDADDDEVGEPWE